MAMNDEHGCTLCKEPGQEIYEEYSFGVGKKRRTAIQYDYRHTNGELFSCCGATLADCRKRRDEWIAKRK